MRTFEAKHEATIARVREKEITASGGVAQSLENLRAEHKTLQTRRREAYALRDEKKKERKALQRLRKQQEDALRAAGGACGWPCTFFGPAVLRVEKNGVAENDPSSIRCG